MPRQAAGERGEQAHVRVREGVLAVEVLERDPPLNLVAAHERRRTMTERAELALDDLASSPSSACQPATSGSTTRGACARRGSRCLSAAAERRRLVGKSNATLDRVRVVHESRRRGRRLPISTTWASKISWILSPTRSYIDCMSRFWRERLLDAVDDRQLGGALIGLRQKPLRLVKEPGVLECDAEARPRAWSESRTSASRTRRTGRDSGS